MAEISIQHEDLSDHLGKIEDYDNFYKTHSENIKRFKKVTEKTLKDVKGRFVFDYVTKYQQFDPIVGEQSMTSEQVEAILKEYPNCFI